MPTHGREAFVAQAVDYFLRQDYPSRELVVVDDGPEPVRDLLPEDPRVVYVRLQRRASTGAKRNLAAEVARGDLLVCWDDDDWFGPGRLSAQVEPLLRGEAEVTALGRSPFYCIPTAQFWRCTPRVHARMFFKQVVGGTLAYRRAPGARFPDASLAEDAALLRTLLNGGARLAPIPNRDLFVYVRHEANSWRFPEGRYLDRQGWHAVAPPPFLPPADLAFYRGLRAPALRAPSARLAETSRQ
jgi:O-antigen biosynthesis protein